MERRKAGLILYKIFPSEIKGYIIKVLGRPHSFFYHRAAALPWAGQAGEQFLLAPSLKGHQPLFLSLYSLGMHLGSQGVAEDLTLSCYPTHATFSFYKIQQTQLVTRDSLALCWTHLHLIWRQNSLYLLLSLWAVRSGSGEGRWTLSVCPV
jgi:hypothetical protein